MSTPRRVKPDVETEGDWLSLVDDYTITLARGAEIVRGRLRPGVTGSDPRLRELVEGFQGRVYVTTEPPEILLVRRSSDEDRPRWWLHIALFVAVLVTTHMAGALMEGVDPFRTRALDLGLVVLPVPTGVDLESLWRGAPFALPFVGVLLAHEMGHYLTARRHGIPVTPPFFIPFPAYWSLIGTLGAFIRIKGPTVRRSILFDVGAAGPLVSFLLSLPILWVGMGLSTVASGAAELSTPFVVPFAGQAVRIGNSPAVHAMAFFHFPDVVGTAPLVLHPVAFAGWLGLFFTALNLLPLGQLDGGHVLYALSARTQRLAGRLFLFALLPLGFLWWGWWLWAVLVFWVNRGRVEHPPVLQPEVPLDRGRAALAWGCVAIFFLTFAPVPLAL